MVPNLKITNVSIFTPATGFSLKEQNVWKQGNHYFGYLVVQKTTGNFGSSTDTIGTMNKELEVPINTGGFLGTTQWTAHRTAYVYINKTGTILVSDSNGSACSFVKIHLDFIAINS